MPHNPSNYTVTTPSPRTTMDEHLAGIDAALGAIAGGVSLQGAWDASTNTPDLNAGGAQVQGHYYRVSVTGSTNLSGITDWQIGDHLFFGADGNWHKIDNTDAVSSVFGRSGPVTAQSGDYSADQVTNAPAGIVASTDMQAAINEVAAAFQSGVATEAALLAATDATNTSGKFPGRKYRVTDRGNITVEADDGTATGAWRTSDGVTVLVPS